MLTDTGQNSGGLMRKSRVVPWEGAWWGCPCTELQLRLHELAASQPLEASFNYGLFFFFHKSKNPHQIFFFQLAKTGTNVGLL